MGVPLAHEFCFSQPKSPHHSFQLLQSSSAACWEYSLASRSCWQTCRCIDHERSSLPLLSEFIKILLSAGSCYSGTLVRSWNSISFCGSFARLPVFSKSPSTIFCHRGYFFTGTCSRSHYMSDLRDLTFCCSTPVDCGTLLGHLKSI